MAFHRRSAWTTTPKTAVKVKRTQTEVYIHWPAHGGVIGRDQARIKSLLRAWWRQHKITQGWSDIAYNLGVDQNGDIWELRGVDRQCGGNGGTTTNRRGQAILAIMGTGESPSQDMIRGIREAVGMIRAEHPSCRKILGHRDSFEASTSCPGNSLYALVKAGAFEPTVKTVAKQADKATPASSNPSAEFADVDKTQAWLIGLGYDPGPIDGKYGTKTEAATRQAQQDLGITPADGRPGPATRTILEDAVSTIDELAKKIDALDKKVQAFGEQNQWRLDKLRGDAAANRWRLDKVPDAIVKAVQETSKAQGLTDDQVQAIASAAAEAAGRVSAEDIAGQLAVTVAKGDG